MVVLDWSLLLILKNASHYHYVVAATIAVPFQKTHFFCEKSQFSLIPLDFAAPPGR
ncbi:MAG: hypothetical protein RIG67_00645 [Rhodospirillales bacterium]